MAVSDGFTGRFQDPEAAGTQAPLSVCCAASLPSCSLSPLPQTHGSFFNAGKTTARTDPCANLQPYLVFQLDEAARCSLGPAVNAVHCPSVAADSSCEAKQTECLPPLCSSFSSPLTSSVFLRPPLSLCFLLTPTPLPHLLPQPVSCSFTPLSVHTPSTHTAFSLLGRRSSGVVEFIQLNKQQLPDLI